MIKHGMIIEEPYSGENTWKVMTTEGKCIWIHNQDFVFEDRNKIQVGTLVEIAYCGMTFGGNFIVRIWEAK